MAHVSPNDGPMDDEVSLNLNPNLETTEVDTSEITKDPNTNTVIISKDNETSPSSEVPTTGFMRLPIELRRQIYKHTFEPQVILLSASAPEPRSLTATPITLRLHHESREYGKDYYLKIALENPLRPLFCRSNHLWIYTNSLTDSLALKYRFGDLSEYVDDLQFWLHSFTAPGDKKVQCVLQNVKQATIRSMLSSGLGFSVLRAILELLDTNANGIMFTANPDGEQDGLTNEEFLKEVTTTFASAAFQKLLAQRAGDSLKISYAGKMPGGMGVGVKWILVK